MFDPTMKLLSDDDEPLLVKLLLPMIDCSADTPTEKLPTDLSTVTLEADAMYRVNAATPFVLHIEYESSWQADRPLRFLRYVILAHSRNQIPIETVVVLLRPEAVSSDLTGEYAIRREAQPANVLFRYHVVRLWEIPPEEFLNAGVGLWPLATLGNVTVEQLPKLMLELKKRWKTLPAHQAADLANATFILMGLRHSEELIEQLYRGIQSMEDSVTYQSILKKGINQGFIQGKDVGREEGIELGREVGREEMAQLALISVLESKFGSVTSEAQVTIKAIDDLDRLNRMLKAVFAADRVETVLNLK